MVVTNPLKAQQRSIPATPINLGVIELSPNIPKHVNVGDGKDWTITETILADGKRQITAEANSKVTAEETNEDWHKSGIPPGTAVGTPEKQTQDMSGLPSDVEITGFFGDKLARYTLKYNAN
jgi:hypothetical protein